MIHASRLPDLSIEETISLLYLRTVPDIHDLPPRHRLRLITLGLARRDGERLCATERGRALAARLAPARPAVAAQSSISIR